MQLLKKNFKVLLLAVFVAAASCSFTTKNFDNPEKDKLLIDLVTYVLEKWHYASPSIDDAFSEAVFTNFIDGLDPIKRYFLKQDILEFEQYKLQIDDQLKMKDLSFFNLVYNRLTLRMEESKTLYQNALSTPFDYTKDEAINVDYDALGYDETKKELQARWRRQLKFSTISTYYDFLEEKQSAEQRKAEAASQSKKYIATVNEGLTDKELEEKSRASTQTNLEEYYDFTDDLQRKDYFAIFLTTIVEQFDPHTNYMAPPDKDRFDQRMSGKLEGVGARLQKKKDYINVMEVISGGPAWRGEHIEVGDILLKVRQEDELEPVSIVGMRIDDAVKLIKGPKGSKVILTVKGVDGSIREEIITRDVVELEETYAKSTLINKQENTFGLINLPAFYFNMQNYKERNAATDIEKELLALKQEGIEGLVLDLRNNGGGSLRTAVDIAGLFIKKGPVVQVASSDGTKDVLEDEDSTIVWDGPLVILVNELSASASEILAAAMQDYKRAIVIGSKQTYGKGTVQNVVDLNRWLRKNDQGDMGALKLTTQKFYRVNGGSTQLEGVKSDVVMPDRYSYFDVGERDYDNPLPYDKISPASYQPWEGFIDYKATIDKSNRRIAQNNQLKLIQENALYIKERRDQMDVTLNLTSYSKQIDQNKEAVKKFDSLDTYDNMLSYRSLPKELVLMREDTTLVEKRKRWHKNLTKDVYLEEAISVLQDLKLANMKNGNTSTLKN
ncbi:MAG: Tail-specific protease [Flavobacteriaceae bacterium]|nr:MAG: Tail-specific protease [Flavobacteriaceae bacterium]